MKLITSVATLALFAFVPLTAPAQSSPAAATSAASAKRTDVYHVFFVKAAPGKAKELADFLKEPDPKAAMPNHRLLLRHQDGDEWDYVEIQHMGTKATVDSAGTPLPPAKRSLMESHNDTFVSGPAWADFAKAMALEADAAQSADAIYAVSDYRATPGHREDLEKMLSTVTPGDASSGNVLFQHIEGSGWNYLAVVRYDSWEKFGENEKSSIAQTKKGEGGWFELRNYLACHHDTLTDRLFP